MTNYFQVDVPCSNCGHYILSDHRWHWDFRYPFEDKSHAEAFVVYDGCMDDCDCQDPYKESGPA